MAPHPIPHSLQWLSTLKSTQLKTLAAAVGTNSSGTKPILISTLQLHLPTGLFPQDEGQSKKKKHDIISIDMGIRNLAYCRISLPPNWPPTTARAAASAVPTISEWVRIAVSPKTSSAISRKKKKVSKADPGAETAEVETTLPAEAVAATAKEPFDPATYSIHAYNLIRHLLTQHPSTPPAQILIERQRFRSMGGSAVQEWTLRVNMFEAMLYAVLRTLKERGEWSGSVEAVAPSKIGRFWLGEGEGAAPGGRVVVPDEESGEEGKAREKPKKVPSKSARTKTAKIRIVERWLEEVLGDEGKEKAEGRLKLEGNARELGEAFLRKRKGGRDVRVREETIAFKSRSEEETVEIGKLDDLADCLLQGMAWVKWEENRRKFLEKGGVILEELDCN